MAVPHSILAAGWIPFAITLLVILVFSFIYVRYYQARYESEVVSTLTAVIGLSVALLTCALVPVDIFLVSFMKDSNGHFKDWANDSTVRSSIEQGVLYTYYTLYSCVLLFAFVLLPLAYFYYEEGDEETTTASRCCTALKYSLVFILMAAVLFLVGALVPFHHPGNGNITNIDDFFKNIAQDFKRNSGEDAISFAVSSLALVGMLAVVVYTGAGMAAWPMDLVKGSRSTQREREDVVEERSQTQTEIQQIRANYRPGQSMSSSDRRRIQELESQDVIMARRERHLVAFEHSCMRWCGMALRPLQLVFGIIFFLLAVLIFVSLLLTGIDKIMHSQPKYGYVLPKSTLPNPVDLTMIFAQKAFPVDYCLMVSIIAFFFFCSMSGIRLIGIWFCWFRMYNIRPQRTRPQALLLLCYLQLFIVMGLNVLIYELTPQYSTFGSQLYVANNSSSKAVRCTTEAPQEDCQMTQFSMLLIRFFYKVWFFGAAYFWLTYVFLLIFLLSFIILVIKKRRSSIEGEVDEDDILDSDEELISP